MSWSWKLRYSHITLLRNSVISFTKITNKLLQERVGGRVMSVPFGTKEAELGALWLHGGCNNPLSNLSTAYNVRRPIADLESLQFINSQGNAVSRNDVRDANSLLASLQGAVSQLQYATSPIDVPLKEYVDAFGGGSDTTSSSLMQQALGTPIAPVQTGAPLTALSSLYYDVDTEFPGTVHLSLGGLGTGVTNWAAKLNISNKKKVMLRQRVTSILFSDLNTTVVTSTGSKYTSQYVICTVPLGVIQAGGVHSNPHFRIL